MELEGLQFVEIDSISQYLVYWIETDLSAEYEADKIVFDFSSLSKLKQDFGDYEKIKVVGFFGSSEEIERTISVALQKPFRIDPRISETKNSRGKIILLSACQYLFVLLTVPTEILIERPFKHQRIEITLFRYLQDICQRVITCPSSECLAQWYTEKEVDDILHPFMKCQGSLKQYEFIKKDINEIKQIDKHLEGTENFSNNIHQNDYYTVNQPNDSQYLLIVENISINSSEIKEGFNLIKKIIGSLFAKQFRGEHTNKAKLQKECTLKILKNSPEVLELVCNAQEAIQSNFNFERQEIFDKCLNVIQSNIFQQVLSKIGLSNQQQCENLFVNGFIDYSFSQLQFDFVTEEFQLNHTISTHKLEAAINKMNNNKKQKVKIDCNIDKLQKLNKCIIESITKANHKLIAQYKTYYDDLMQKILNQSFINCRKISINPHRDIDNSLQKLVAAQLKQDFQISQENTKHIFQLKRENSLSLENLNVLYFFSNKQLLYDIIIISECVEQVVFVLINCKGQLQLRQKIERYEDPIFFYNRQDQMLTGFNKRYQSFRLRFDDVGKIIEEKVYFNQQDDIIKSAAYLDFDQSFILLTEKKQLKKWQVKGSDELIGIKELQLDPATNAPQEIPFKPSDGSPNYEQVQSTSSGNHFYLISNEAVDVFNINNLRIKCICISDTFRHPIKIFEDLKDVFIIQFTKQRAIVLTNLSNQTELVENEKQQDLQIDGNFILDIVKGSFAKFGDNNLFLQTYIDKTLNLYVDQKAINMMKNYFDALDFSGQVRLLPLEYQLNQLALERDLSPIFTVIGTRVPIQLCTIENGQLIPLIDGFRQNFAQKQQISVSEKSKMLSFHYLDYHLQNINGPIFVISIMGKQSSGKSYLLNRLFGTKFAVAASRCTDGIWASIARVEDMHLLVLDCEGLFSSRRTVSEETQLMSFLAGLCDITILNQDLSFNRNVNELFEKLTNAIGILRGDSLFKGQLLVAVRDISSSDNKGGEQELLRHMEDLKTKNKKQSSFLTQLFNDKFLVQLFHNFEQEKLFNEELKQLRQCFLKMARDTKHWTNGTELLEKMKILLVQLEMQDDESSEKVYLQLQLDKEMENCMNNWIKYFEDHTIEYKGVIFNQKQLKLSKDDSKVAKCFEQIVENLKKEIKQVTSVSKHNENLIEVQFILQQIIDQRAEMIMAKSFLGFTKSTSNPQLQQIIDHHKNALKQFLDLQKDQFKFCDENCSKCYLQCSLMKSHSQKNKEEREKLYQQLNCILKRLNKKEGNDVEIQKTLAQRDCLISKLDNIKLRLSHFQKELEIRTIYYEITQIEKSCDEIKFQFKSFKLLKFSPNYVINYQELNNELLHLLQNDDQRCQDQEETCDLFSSYQEISEEKQVDISDFLNHLRSQFEKVATFKEEYKMQKVKLQNQLKQLHTQLQKHDIMLLQRQLSQNKDEQCQNQSYLQHMKIQSDIFEQQIKKELDSVKNYTLLYLSQEQSEKFDLFPQIIKTIQNNDQIELDNMQNLIKQAESDLLQIHQIYQIKSQQLRQYYQKLFNKRVLRKTVQKQKREVYIRKIKSQTIIRFRMRKDKQIQIYQGDNRDRIWEEQVQIWCKLDKQSDCFDELLQKFKSYEEEIQQKNQVFININKKLEIYSDLQNKCSMIQSEMTKLNNQSKNLEEKCLECEESISKIKADQSSLNQEIIEIETKSNKLEEQLKLLSEYRKELEDYQSLDKKLLKLQTEKDQHKQYLQTISEQGYQPIPSESLLERIKSIRDEIQNQKLLETEIQKRLSDLTNLSADFSEKIDLETKIKKLDELIRDEHNCGRETHQCDLFCFVCNNEKKNCKLQAGHPDGDHLCEKLEHKCINQCEQIECTNSCRFLIKHGGPHRCDQKHDCKERCQFCTQFCHFERSEEHIDHICKTSQCMKKCYLCNRKCRYEHEHTLHDDPQVHLCEDNHQCAEECSKPGICKIDYREEQKQWKTEITEFMYTSFVQVPERDKCRLLIPTGKLKHDGEHECQTEKHRCIERCLECEGFCTREKGHDGQHTTHTHRNKDNQIFTKKIGPDMKKNETIKLGTEREYKVGESSSPETCTLSCTRRGRAHFHLLRCQGDEKCLEKLHSKQKARHSQSKYQGFEDIMFDEVLCTHFWNLLNWQNPSPNLDIISSCNAYCGSCKVKEKNFCTKSAWHIESITPDQHEFKCTELHYSSEGLCIAFVLDTTGSMSSYIEMCKNVIRDIIDKTLKKIATPDKLKFAIVSYKDHTDSQVINKSDFGDHIVATKFLNTLTANGGGDAPEAVLDGLHTALNLSWLDKYDKILFLIGDAPAHGRQYNGGIGDSYPEGCPCGLNGSTIMRAMKSKKIDFKILALNSSLNIMIAQFKADYSELETVTATSAKEFGDKIVQNVVEMLETDELTFQR